MENQSEAAEAFNELTANEIISSRDPLKSPASSHLNNERNHQAMNN